MEIIYRFGGSQGWLHVIYMNIRCILAHPQCTTDNCEARVQSRIFSGWLITLLSLNLVVPKYIFSGKWVPSQNLIWQSISPEPRKGMNTPEHAAMYTNKRHKGDHRPGREGGVRLKFKGWKGRTHLSVAVSWKNGREREIGERNRKQIAGWNAILLT